MRIIYAVIAYMMMGGVCIWVGYMCWKDSKKYFRMIIRDVKRAIKKGVRGGRNAHGRQSKIIYIDFTKETKICQEGHYEKN